MYRKYSNHIKKYIFHLLNHIVHLIIEFRFCCFYMIHHTVVFEKKNVKTSFTIWHIWRCSLIQRHPTSGIYDLKTEFLFLTYYFDYAGRESFPLAWN